MVIFTDGSFTKAGKKPATAGWGFVVQAGQGEVAIHEGSGPLVTPDAVAPDGALKPTNKYGGVAGDTDESTIVPGQPGPGEKWESGRYLPG